jgi:hypothetical protein
MAKKIVIEGIEIVPSIKLCGGCENITCGCPTGWECMYQPENNDCEYPASMLARRKSAQQPLEADGGDSRAETQPALETPAAA